MLWALVLGYHTVRAGYQGTEAGRLWNLGILSSILFLLLIGPARLEWERKGPLSCSSIFWSAWNYPGSACLPGLRLERLLLPSYRGNT